MKELLLTRDSAANKIGYYHLMLFLISLPFDRFYSHVILISFIIHTLIQLNKQHIQPVFTLRTLSLQSVFFVTVISTIYSINKTAGFSEWWKQIVILIFPLVFCFSSLDLKKYRQPLLLAFSLVCTATVIYLYFDAFHTIRHYHLPFKYIFSSGLTNHNFSEPIDMHATFLSMQLAIALIYLLYVIITQTSKSYKVFYVLCACILIAGIVQLCSKSIFFCLFIIINIAIPYFLLSGDRRWNYILITASVSIALILCILKVPTLRERYITDLQDDLTEATFDETFDPRLARWDAVGELILKKPITGYGAGSEMGLLQDAFFSKKFYNSYLHQLNAHSQYLSFLLKSGIIGLLVYLATLTLGIKLAFQNKDLLFLSFMLLIVIVSFSENLLDVDKGIIFYAFFFSFFVFSTPFDKNSVNFS